MGWSMYSLQKPDSMHKYCTCKATVRSLKGVFVEPIEFTAGSCYIYKALAALAQFEICASTLLEIAAHI